MALHTRNVSCFLLYFTFLASLGEADLITLESFGRPVVGIGDSTAAVPNYPAKEGDSYYNPNNGRILFYIPLEDYGDYGLDDIFGVSEIGTTSETVGTVSDDGIGGHLTMFLYFEHWLHPADEARLSFNFWDLDLAPVNDPIGFFESVQFYDRYGSSISDPITMRGQTPGEGDLEFTVTGDHDTQTIQFDDITSVIDSNPFYLELKFTSQTIFSASNTKEKFSAILTTKSSVPEPSTILLLGLGLIGVVLFGRRQRQRGRIDPGYLQDVSLS